MAMMTLLDGATIEIPVPSPDDTHTDDVHGDRVRGTEGVTEFSTAKPWPCGSRRRDASERVLELARPALASVGARLTAAMSGAFIRRSGRDGGP